MHNGTHYPLQIEEADNPSEYLWHNLEVSGCKKQISRGIWNLLTIAMIALCWWLIYKLMSGWIESSIIAAILIQVLNNVVA